MFLSFFVELRRFFVVSGLIDTCLVRSKEPHNIMTDDTVWLLMAREVLGHLFVLMTEFLYA